MKLKKLVLENFRGKAHLDIALGSRLTVLLAANGGGKTSVLDGIAIGLGEVLTHLPQVAGLSFKKTPNGLGPTYPSPLTRGGAVW